MEGLTRRALKQAAAIGKKGLQKILWLKDNIGTQGRHNFRGSLGDPLLYFLAFSVILFGFASFAPFYFGGSSSYINVASAVNKDSLQNSGGLLTARTILAKESPDLYIIQRSSLAAATPPVTVNTQVLGDILGQTDFAEDRRDVVEYTAEQGETVSSIAQKFNISTNTVLWANNLTKNSAVRAGQKMIILPVSGVIHHVKSGDTVGSIAQKYKSVSDKIIDFNNLESEGDIYIGDILIIPDGIMPPSVKYAPPSLAPLASSYFICPLAGCRITQGLHWYNAIDFSNGQCGEPIYAAASGEVLKVGLTDSRSRWAFGGAGNHIKILHPNGAVTFYGHVQSSLVNSGDKVLQGQIIALVGGAPGTPGAGKSTGCHVHFEVLGARNPFAR